MELITAEIQKQYIVSCIHTHARMHARADTHAQRERERGGGERERD